MPANAPGIPEGDYQSSCRGCKLDDTTVLSCSHCEKPCGARIQTSLDTTTCSEAATVTNSAGHLACKEPPPANADNLPDGTYLGSCHGCTLSDGTLSCTECVDGAGKRQSSTLALAGCDLTSISNEQGSLSCTSAPRQLDEQVDPAPPSEPAEPAEEPTEPAAVSEPPSQEPTGSAAGSAAGHDEL